MTICSSLTLGWILSIVFGEKYPSWIDLVNLVYSCSPVPAAITLGLLLLAFLAAVVALIRRRRKRKPTRFHG